MIGKIINHIGNKLVIEFEDEINSNFLELLANNDDNLAKVELLDNRQMSQKQNALSHVLIADVARWSYDEPKWIESVLKYYYEAKSGVYFEHSRATKNEATEWIGFLIEFILKNDIPLEKRYQYLLENNKWFYYCLKYRKCCICGKHADVCHIEVVGMGRNRKKISHENFTFYAGCRFHHQEEHRIGTKNFLNKYQIKPVKLNIEERKKLNIGG
ncbi:putative HNHc nuclease [Enterococcus faecalis]|uniref:putative HNHc nuclease n=1 Tax=Enterococcus faecalis TaxID=1351 RepID=UPI00233055A1|nr:putative HNHc nuclease [Enterococcus faecalis]MDB1649533.1 putative HNHc nuclease [Enterococcus faecalis]MDB1659799.1 putative HNHc nuclease [Enterococcus faecalis]